MRIMQLTELRADQRRQLIDAQQAFRAWRTADREFSHSYRGEMHWRKVDGREYLSRKYHKAPKSIRSRAVFTTVPLAI